MILDFSQNGLTVVFEVNGDGSVVLSRLHADSDRDERPKKAVCATPVEVHLSGRNHPDDFCGARHTGTVGARDLRYVSHETLKTADGKLVKLLMSDGCMNVTLHYRFYDGVAALRTWTTVENVGNEPLGLEYVSSFSYTGLDGGEGYRDADSLEIFVPHNAWSREVNWHCYSPLEFGLERWEHYPKRGISTKRIAFSNTGTWSSKEFLPMGAVVNTSRHSAWMFQIEHNGSWNWEISDTDNMLYLKLSGPSEQENGWYKRLMPGESFESVKAAIAVGTDFDTALAEMTHCRRRLFQNSDANRSMPVIFNDYMNCLWGDPTEDRELPVIDRAAETGAEYFCMDAGWYADGAWWETVGEWKPEQTRFPHGIKYVFDYIRKKGMIPGIWLEIEVMGIQCPIAREWEDECFFMRHGKRVIDHGRYQLDFRHPRVRRYATDTVDRLVNEYGVRYLKMDYNIDGGVGTEVDSDSFGDGLLAHNRAYLSWMRETMERYPDLIWECCSSGGMRMDYAMLSMGHLQSVTDQSYYLKNAPIAALAGTAVLPEQGAIWSYPMPDGDRYETELNMINTMLGRIHLSGAITLLSPERFALVQEAIACYKTYRDELSSAVPFYPLGLPNYRDGFLCSALRFSDCIRMAVWRIDAADDCVTIPLTDFCHAAKILYPSDSDCSVSLQSACLSVQLPARYRAVLIEIK